MKKLTVILFAMSLLGIFTLASCGDDKASERAHALRPSDPHRSGDHRTAPDEICGAGRVRESRSAAWDPAGILLRAASRWQG